MNVRIQMTDSLLKSLLPWIYLALILFCFFMVSCASVDPVNSNALQDVQWNLESVQLQGGEALVPVPGEEYFLRFGSDGFLSGRVHCNVINAEYGASDGELFVGPVAMTRAFCPPSAVADAFLSGINRMTAYRIQEDRLFIILAGGGTMSFIRAPGQ
jgi:para-nitrobenzyl esterase